MRIIVRLIPWVSCAPVTALARDQQQPVPVTGMTTGLGSGAGECPTRWEVNAMHDEGGPRWDLYIQGLAALQNKTDTDELSHFGISGIHGRPYIPYNGVGPVSGDVETGFCPHGEKQFVAWHRPYLALYEQTLGAEIQHIASEYSGDNASAYRDAADAFRLPYWDWAADPTLPPACAPERVKVWGPGGALALRNPLYSYRWPEHPLNQTLFPGSLDWPPETTRASNSSAANPDFSPDAVNANLRRVADQIKDQVYRTFTYASTYDQMSSMADPTGVSLEASHNIIHNAVGGSFASLDITAFDPLFMLHHANLDRLAALWRAAHGNATDTWEPYASPGLYGTARGANVTAESPLRPFYQPDGRAFHTGLSAAATPPFGYGYAELADWDRARDDAAHDRARRGVVARVIEVYGGGGGSGGGDGKATVNKAKKLDSVAKENAEGKEEEEWFLKVAVDRSDLELPCSINVFAGDILAGCMALLAMPREGLAHAEIPLQRTVRRLGLDAADRSAVEQALREQLRAEVRGSNGTTTDAKTIASLQLHLMALAVTTHGSKSEFPVYGERTTYVKILPAS